MSRVITTFLNPGDWFLAEEWTYPSVLISAQPWGIKAAPVAADGEGLCAADLRRVLVEWNEVERGSKRSVSPDLIKPRTDCRGLDPMFSTPFPSARIPLVV